MRRVIPFLIVAVGAVVAGCGSSSSSSTTASSAAPATTTSSSSAPAAGGSAVTLTETEFKISPASKTAATGAKITITVKNSGTTAHALTVETPSGPVSTSDIAPGGSATITVNASKAGHYTFFCPIDGHRKLGMEGVLIVGGASASASGGVAPATTASSSTSSAGGGSSNGY